MKKLTALFLALTLLLSGCGCRPLDLMANTTARAVSLKNVPDGNVDATGFALRLFRNSFDGQQNTSIAPLSVLSSLGMALNGADNQTRTQMEQVLGFSSEDLNAWIYTYLKNQSQELKLANSIWFTDSRDLKVNKEFLETNAGFYQAGIFQTAFDDKALTAINEWVAEHTNGMIPNMLDELPQDSVMFLINALAFDAKWEDVFHPSQVRELIFTKEDGTEQVAQMMHGQVSAYLEDDTATGFLKYYEGKKYAFAALLPKEGTRVADFAAALTEEHLQTLLSNPQDFPTYIDLPKFEAEYDVELSQILGDLGMPDAFNPLSADFSRLGSYPNENIYIGEVLHKTAITVDEEGTRAAAATTSKMAMGSAIRDVRYVTLDRPFVYMLIDCEQNTPFFLGALMDAEA